MEFNGIKKSIQIPNNFKFFPISRVQSHSLEEQLRIVSAREQRLQVELETLRQTRFSTERVALTLQEVESVLKRVDAEKQGAMEGQLQALALERDRLNELVKNIKDQHTQMTNDLKVFIYSFFFNKFLNKYKTNNYDVFWI